MQQDNINEEIRELEILNKALTQENIILNQDLIKVQTNQQFVCQQKYDANTLKMTILAQKYEKKESSELKFCLYEDDQVLEITGLIQLNLNEYFIFSQRVKLLRKTKGNPKIIQTEKSIEITFDIKPSF